MAMTDILPALKADPADRPAPARVRRRAKPAGDGGKRGKRGPKPGRKRGWLGRLLAWAATLAIWAIIAVAGLVAWYAWDLPDIDKVTAAARRPGITFLSADGETFATFGDLYGDPVNLSDLPAALPQAVLATEDRRFHEHFGLDPVGLLRAAYVNLRAGRVVQGGSTITQQLAKNLFLTPERSLKRKVQELLMAFWLEQRLSKERILTLYLNRVYLGAGTYGVDAAARRYYGVPARNLSLYQSASIAGLLKAPSRYNPLADPEASRRRTEQVLANMVAAGYLAPDQAKASARQGPGPLRRLPPGGRYFADWLYPQVEEIGGGDRDLVVVTTLDMRLQRKVEAELEATLAEAGAKAGVGQGAVVAMSPDGAIRAMTGGRDYNDSQFNRATQGLRQPGSAFKPFVYLAALEAGMTPDDVVEDAPLKLGKWAPQNFTGRYAGPVTLRDAVAQSINTVAVRVSEKIGRRRVMELARRLGITSELRNDASIALGTSEVTLIELTGAYAAFANGGAGIFPHGIAEVRDGAGRVLWRRQPGGAAPAVGGRALGGLNAMLGMVMVSGTGKAAALDRPAAGKTGTTQDYRDAWFVGFTADLVTGVWLGNDDSRPMKKVTGGGLPAELWKRVMLAAHAGQPPRPLPGALPAEAPPQPWADSAGVEGESLWDSLVRKVLGR